MLKHRPGFWIILLLVGQIYLTGYVLMPLAVITTHRDQNTIFLHSKYISLVLAYLCIAACVWIERKHLADFHIDRASLVALVLSTVFVFRPRLDVRGEFLYLSVIMISGIWILVAIILTWSEIPKTNWGWVGIGVMLTGVALIPLNLLDYAANAGAPIAKLGSLGHTLGLVVGGVIYNLAFTAIIEEIIFRGFLWGYLLSLGWSERKAMFVQGILFWFAHANSGSALTFLVTIPLVTMVLSLLTHRSKQVFPSVVSHTMFNTLGSLVWRILLA